VGESEDVGGMAERLSEGLVSWLPDIPAEMAIFQQVQAQPQAI
jgi:hypothetical protein